MSLDNVSVIDAVGTDRLTGKVVLTIIDSWDWSDERLHLIALQDKINSYFEFIESKQLFQSYPDAENRPVQIDLIAKFPLSLRADDLLKNAALVARTLDVEVTFQLHEV